MEPIYIYLVASIILSIISFFLYTIDKRRAIKNKWRIKEAVLLSFGLIGGAIGSLIAMKTIRHKTKHWYFWVVNVIGLIIQCVIIYILI